MNIMPMSKWLSFANLCVEQPFRDKRQSQEAEYYKKQQIGHRGIQPR